nr:heme attachment to plastid cytochrome c [Chlamydomonas sp. UWO 241]
MYSSFEIFLANFSFLILFISMIVYWIQASNFQTKNESTLAGFENGSFNILNWTFIAKKIFNLKTIGTILTLLANASLFCLLILRWKESGHFPLSNLYESLMFLSWSLTVIHLTIEMSFSSITSGVNNELLLRDPLRVSLLHKGGDIGVKTIENSKKGVIASRLIGSITAPSALFTNAFATFSLPKEMQEASPLVPALQSNWLMMHVTVMILSYAALILGSLLSIGFLVITNGKNINLNPNFETSTKSIVQFNYNEGYRGNLAKTLDNLSYRVLGVGFPLLTIGILSGAVWANEAWGSYWSWDPKETWALLTWLVFAIYLHTRLTKGWEGRKPALIASLGFVTVWICFLGVNLIGEGLHSYGWFS